MKQLLSPLTLRGLVALFVVIAATSSAFAQAPTPLPRKVIVTTEYFVKAGMLGQYLNLIRTEGRPLYLKAGARHTEVYTRIFGQTGSAIVLEYYDSFADMTKSRAEFAQKGGEALQLFNLKAQQFIAAPAKQIILRSFPEGTWINPQANYKPTKYFVITHRWIAPFRNADYTNYLVNDYLPLFKKSEEIGIIISLGSFGDEPQVFVSTPLADLSDLDRTNNSLSKVISPQELNKLQQQKLNGVVTRTEQYILRFWEDLSISTKQSQEANK